MKYYDAKWIGSSANKSQWPNTTYPEMVFAGRSNAGKSSLINALVNRKNLAYEGKTPGKTRLLNFFEVNEQYVLTDAPGYGYAKGSKQSFIDFGELMEPYFHERKQLKLLIMVLDIRRTPNEDDIRMVNFAKENHLAIIGACTKSDKLSNNQQITQRKMISETLGIPKEKLVICSCLKKTGMEQLWDLIEKTL
ncbi:MAG: YihA family ribosome biogenesis GTP-binding protein [Solobacterium sp.]|nr:YihA family ribosome biogenesis GTP-binding protein [Solobacterium sp.]